MTSLRTFVKKVPWLVQLFLPLRSVWRFPQNAARFLRTVVQFRLQSSDRFAWSWLSLYPCLQDATATTPFDRHYLFHTAWAARHVAQQKPALHIDFSSAIYFSTLVSAFVPVHFYDFRPALLKLSGLTCGQADLNRLALPSNSIASLSCMHVLEHLGLGRYGDPVDPAADQRAFEELQRVAQPGGDLYVVVPLAGTPALQFNAHRIYSREQVLSAFGARCDLLDFMLIPDDPLDGDCVSSPSEALLQKQQYACGCFWFRKSLPS